MAGAARSSPTLFKQIQGLIDEADVVVAFNIKFDLHWLRKVGIHIGDTRIFDCQLAEFVLERQQNAYPSLEGACVKYDLGHKLDIIKTEYWDKGINTDDIPWPVLKPYAALDAELTYKLYQVQQTLLTPLQRRLLAIQNQDILVLEEMEWNGLLYDDKLCETRSLELDDQISKIKSTLAAVYPEVPVSFSSPDNVSAFLYGGIVKEDTKEHIGFFKSGERKGEMKYKNVEVEHQLPRLCTPLRGSELKKPGFYSTAEDILKQLRTNKANQTYINLILELSKLEKLNGTYYTGLPKLNGVMNWPARMLHGNFNTCVARTSRLSSSRPKQLGLSNKVNSGKLQNGQS